MKSSATKGGCAATSQHVIADEDARRAALAINEYMTNWNDKDSLYRGARVNTMGGFRGLYYGQDRLLWLVNRWDRIELSALLFEERSGRISLVAGDAYFLARDLYPDDDQKASQKGGAA